MGKYFYKAIRLLFRFYLIRIVLIQLINFFKNIDEQKKWSDRKPIDSFIKTCILKEPIVRNGYFKGMKYPVFQAAGSAVYPKFIGSYENELNFIIKKIIDRKYDLIIDVGCAEGYYAIGFARIFSNAKIYAYDTEQKARQLCADVAKINHVNDRVTIKSKLDANELRDFNFQNKNVLIISDCEGYEKYLFTSENIRNLKNCDILIETHDLFDLSISSYLINLFKATHCDPIIVASIDDNKKAQTYNFPETTQLDLSTKKILFAEERKAVMEWLFFQKQEA